MVSIVIMAIRELEIVVNLMFLKMLLHLAIVGNVMLAFIKTIIAV